MKNICFAALLGILFLSLGGCYKFMAVHPEKSDAQFYQDQKECEQRARDYAKTRVQDWGGPDDTSYGRSVSDSEINTSRRCMRDKGWSYHFRK